MSKTDLISNRKSYLPYSGRKVMLDRDLALLYGVQTKILNKAAE